ncbi:MAG: hypothetical protein E7328_06395 [Clostridiales bacterium]|nr:hypothetical protein [Clostridiales bacterium]
MYITALIIGLGREHLLVLDLDTRTRIRVNTREALRYRIRDLVRIRYNGVMTRSIPPQITAGRIVLLHRP